MLLRNKDKQALVHIFSSVPIPMEVWAYGSRVNGTAHEGSDLDLVIHGPNKEKFPIDVLSELKEKIRESNIPILVELFDWERIPESFKQNIITQHEILFSSTGIEMNEPDNRYGASSDNP